MYIYYYLSKPTIALKRQADYLLSYLGSSNALSICIAPSNDQIHAYIDASYAIHPDSLSHYGLAICLDDTGYAFHSKSSPIKTVCRSSTEADIHAANEACSDVLHAVDLLTEIGHPQKPVVFYEDNQAVISLMLKSDFNYRGWAKIHSNTHFSILITTNSVGFYPLKNIPPKTI